MTATVTDSHTKELAAFSNLLWRERTLLHCVLFRIMTQQLILQAGQSRWLASANDEIELAASDLRISEVVRCDESASLAKLFDLEPDATLLHIAEAAPEPWHSVLIEHREALRDLATEVETAAGQNHALVGAGSRAVRDTLMSLSDSVATYDATGVPAGVTPRRLRVDQQA